MQLKIAFDALFKDDYGGVNSFLDYSLGVKTFLILLSLFLSSYDRAEARLEMNEVASAFTWFKIAPDFPVVVISKGDDQVSFRVFDDVYTITSEEHLYKIVKNHYLQDSMGSEVEMVKIDSMAIEKILKFVKAKDRSQAVLNSDLFKNSIRFKKNPEGLQPSQTIYQCSSDLPTRIAYGRGPISRILSHTWIQNGAQESFGMPDTDDSTYFGGRAHIRTPDSFILRGPKHLECTSVYIPDSVDEPSFSKRVACVARSLSIPQNPIFENGLVEQQWVAHFDYHALERNCLMATRFALECAGAHASQVVNVGIGGQFDWSDLYSVSDVPMDLKNSILELRHQLETYRHQISISDFPARSEEILNQALDLDAKLRGVIGISKPKNLREICNLALESCPS